MKEKIEQALDQAKASIELENIEITPEHTELVRARLMDEISEEEFQRRVLELVLDKK
ncbi:hypothetical protein ACFFJY_02845 [Fictibacillus aquaticus]|uniref:hypothetical protein n=1 Tax=Fictibacillus aquaticus TaxID=2021314 RepID=UPI0013FE0B0A|nr:hypothetical protein [Fictibacillus aquaticus]